MCELPPEFDDFDLQHLSRPNALPEDIDYETHIIGTYTAILPRKMDAFYMMQAVCVEQSTGTFVPVPAETPETRRRHVAKVIGLWQIPDFEYDGSEDFFGSPKQRQYVIQIAFPLNFKPQFPMLFTTIYGNISMGGPLKLVDVRFPKAFLSEFKGPKFGDVGIRKILGVKERPLLNNMIKPCVYTDPKIGATLAYDAAVGGCDVIKDDELIADVEFNPVIDRTVAFMEALDKADSEKGEKTLYTVNITDRVDRMFELADIVQEHGANALMVNHISTGYSAMRKLAEDPSVKVPILGHMDLAGAFYQDPLSGISSPLVLGKFGRLAGCDTIVHPAPYGKAPTLADRFKETARQMVMPMRNAPHIKRTLPMPSGGITVSLVEKAVADLGKNIMIGSGGGIHAHPSGPIAGAKAFRQAIDAVMNGIPVKQYAKDHKELAEALGLFGFKKTEFTSV
ncbi:MAG: ribulose 1,5-bisphosphate carboxylase [Candidatus Lokiarchaeota archaeon]|nr:ribulose 1,5-bisphosphate carboxylase [Candidatus Lokiarchaeota archaeon]